MKIEKDRFYKTREGQKVTIYKTDCISMYPIHGSISICGKDQFATWTHFGKYSTGNDHGLWDIVSEWEDPKPFRPLRHCWISGEGFAQWLPAEVIPNWDPGGSSYVNLVRAPWLDEPEAK